MQIFDSTTYPLATGSCKREEFRLENYLTGNPENDAEIENNLWKCIIEIASTRKPVVNHNDYEYIGSGWEWSVFYDRERNRVIKVPAGIFKEVNTQTYFQNTKVAYNLVRNYFPGNFIAVTSFPFDLVIEQEYFEGKNNFLLRDAAQNKVLLRNLKTFLSSCVKMLTQELWLPDFNITLSKEGFNIANVMFNSSFIPKIIDFTAYYDVYRMYPERTVREVENNLALIEVFLTWIQYRLS